MGRYLATIFGQKHHRQEKQERQERVRVRRGRVQGAAGEEKEKTNTRLSCSARGNPPPTLYWTMDGKIVKNTHQTRIITKK